MGFGLTKTVGSTFSLREDAITSRTIDTEFLIGTGLFTGSILVHKFGYNDDVDSAEDIWYNGGTHTYPTTAETLSIVSLSSSDTSAGVGARTLYVEGVDASYNLQNEIVTLTGTTPVLTVNTYRRFHRAYVATAGTSKVNVGRINITNSSSALTLGSVQASYGQTGIARYTIPTGYTGYLVKYVASMLDTNANSATMAILVNDIDNNVSRITRPFAISTSNNFIQKNYGALIYPERTDIKFRCLSVANANAYITVDFDIVLISNT